MNIKKIFAMFSSRSGKIKLAALAGLVCVAAVALFFLINDKRMDYAIGAGCTSGAYSCGPSGELVSAVGGGVYRCDSSGNWYNTGQTRCDSDEKCCATVDNKGAKCISKDDVCAGSASKTQTAAPQTAQTSFLPAPGMAKVDGAICPCGSGFTGICSSASVKSGDWCQNGSCNNGKCGAVAAAPAAGGACQPNAKATSLESQMKGNNCPQDGDYYCASGKCQLGCLGYKEGSVQPIFVGSGNQSCLKPTKNFGSAVDARYICGASKKTDWETGKPSGTLEYEYYDEAGGHVYQPLGLEVDESKLCYEDYYDKCVNNECAKKSNNCNKAVDAIIAAFNQYLSSISTLNSKNENLQVDGKTTHPRLDAYKTKRATISSNLSKYGINADTIEKMLDFGNRVKGVGAKTKDISILPVLTKAPEFKEIACQYLTGTGAKNSWCESSKDSQFYGYSFKCQSVNGCDMWSWVKAENSENCKNKNSPINVWNKFLSRTEEVPESGNLSSGGFMYCARDMAVYGGRNKSGCGYYAIALPVLDTNGKQNTEINGLKKFNDYDYVMTNECWKDTDKSPTNCSTEDETSVTPSGETFNFEKCDGTDAMIVDGQTITDSSFCDSYTDLAIKTECKTTLANCKSGQSSDTCPVEFGNEGAGVKMIFNKNKEKAVACSEGADKGCPALKDFAVQQAGLSGVSLDQECLKSLMDSCAMAFSQCGGGGNCTLNEYKCGNCTPRGEVNNLYRNVSCVCGKEVNGVLDWILNDDCTDKGGCDTATGQCKEGGDCSTAPQGCSADSQCVSQCGQGWTCQPKEDVYSIFGYEVLRKVSSSGVCVNEKLSQIGECKAINVTKGSAYETTGSCGSQSCKGACIPFTVKTEGTCSSITCKVVNTSDGTEGQVNHNQNSSSWFGCLAPKTSSASYSAKTNTSGSNSSTTRVNYTITCTDGKVDSNTVTGSCDINNPNNPFNEGQEGDKCKSDRDCQEGLVCKDGECVSEEEAEEQEEEDSTAPQVTIEAPNGTIETKTAKLEASTDIAATCKYYLDKENSSNWSGGGRTMSGSGTSHTATLSNLTEGEPENCKYAHTVTVMCKNAKASSKAGEAAVGEDSASFEVDLSKDDSNAPKVSDDMEDEYTQADPTLKVITDRPADCEYKEGSSFTFGSGKDFETTGDYNHNTDLKDLKSDDYEYYVVCKDKNTCAVSDKDFKVEFKVTLEDDPENAPKITNTTPATQIVANPTLSATTDRPATCQYKKDSTFKYGDGAGKNFANDNGDGGLTHTQPLSESEYPNGDYDFYVACKASATGATATTKTPIETKLNRGGDDPNAPMIYNTTPANQTTSSPTLSVVTKTSTGLMLNAACQYKEGVDFTYGGGTQFATDGGSNHSAVLSGLADGSHTYYVVCHDPATNLNSKPGAQIVFTTSAGSTTCADLKSNDKQSDEDRDYDDGDDADSKYLWRSVEDGTRESFTKVDWHAGYQFTPDENGFATQLCGYFESGQSNKVSLYNSSYEEIAGAEVEGEDGWNCVSVSPVEVKADKRYYVIARVEEAPIYYEYDSGLLPRDAENATIDAGIRQLADEDFGNNIKKYDYIIFGLVDVKINFTGESDEGPEISSPEPEGEADSDTVLSVETDIDATCKFDREDVDYGDMRYDFGSTGQKEHAQKVCDLDDGPFTWYVRCKGATGENNASTLIQFEVE